MKKLIILALIGVSLSVAAKPLQEQIKRLQRAAALYAKNEMRTWRCLSELNNKISRIECKIHKYRNHKA